MTRWAGWVLFLVATLLFWAGLGLATFCAAMPVWQDIYKYQVDLPVFYQITNRVLTSPLNFMALLLGLPLVLAVPLALMKSDTLRAWVVVIAVALLMIVPIFTLFSMLGFLANITHILLPGKA